MGQELSLNPKSEAPNSSKRPKRPNLMTYLVAVLILCIAALTFDMLGVCYGLGGVGGLVALAIPFELLAMGLMCYIMGKLKVSLIFPLFLVSACVAGELVCVNTSNLQPLGETLFYIFLSLLFVVAVAGSKISRC